MRGSSKRPPYNVSVLHRCVHSKYEEV
jgi:hypothetical protein